MKRFPTKDSGLIPSDIFGRDYAELQHWLRQCGTSLHERCLMLIGDPVQLRKRQLLKLAKNGANRPSSRTDLGRALTYYTSTSAHSFDNNFNATIRKSRPDWFESSALRHKAELLKLAARGARRPTADRDKLGRLLSSYTNRSGNYDAAFDGSIRALRPDWFQDTASLRKMELLARAKRGEPRPVRGTKNQPDTVLGSALSRYLITDLAFRDKIRHLRPDWFERSSAIKKETLIRMARANKNRPVGTLGAALSSYTANAHVRTYDQLFNRKIRKLRPDWFEKTSTGKKLQLIVRAKKGAPRPALKSRNISERQLGSALARYTKRDNGCFDSSFDAKIRGIRPDWFEDTVATKKTQLLSLARSGSRRPSSHTGPTEILGTALCRFTHRGGQSFDSDFDTQIRQLRPDWFENTLEEKKKRLFEIARDSHKRPSSYSKDITQRQLGEALIRCTNINNPGFDAKFNRRLRALRPDWFSQ